MTPLTVGVFLGVGAVALTGALVAWCAYRGPNRP